MKILLINDFLSPVGGAENYLFALAKLLERNGHQVKIIGGDYKENDFRSFFSRVFSLRYYSLVKEQLRDFNPDIVHVHGLFRAISPSAVIAASRNEFRVVITVHDFHLVCPKTFFLYQGEPCIHGFSRRCLSSVCYPQTSIFYATLKIAKIGFHRWIVRNNVDKFICPSRLLATWLGRSLKTDKVVYVPHFVEPNSRATPGTFEKNCLLFIGRLSPEKGVDYLLSALPAVSKEVPDVFLTIVGDGSEKSKLELYARKLNVLNRVEFLGVVPNDELFSYYQRAAIVVIPSICVETGPIVALEAMAHGRPLVASNIGGLSELAKDGHNGLLVEPQSHWDLKSKIVALLKNPSLVERMGMNGRKLFESKFSPEKHIVEIERVYRDCYGS